MLFSGLANAQDIVKLTSGAELNIKILGNNAETISFSRNQQEMQYFIAKGEIDEIKYENGTVEKIEHPELTFDQASKKVIELIDTYAVNKDGTRKMKATLEDKHLRLSEVNKNGEADKGQLFDMKKIIRFDETAYRREGFAFVNIWTMMLENEKKNEWVRFKLVIRTDSHEKAAVLTDALRQLNRALKANR